MTTKVFAATLGLNVLFLATGCLQLAFSLVAQSRMDSEPPDGRKALRNLLYQKLPLTAAVVNGALVLATFVFTLLGLVTPRKGALKMGAFLVILCGLFTLGLGAHLWIMTLRLRDAFFPTYLDLDPAVQSLIQQSVR
ncbi:hypothetical protein UVI_02032420 [Ustilaginoidea virens]|uniref:Tetraspanin n=1 Tax=Ustilaginoidea virens TaxID=1159556 RepID=A0A1B5KUB9_USTVR|nr:hypothetical protein UVI_02032420 [Ustilaginoidea virens]